MFYFFLIIKTLFVFLAPILSIKKLLKKDNQNQNPIAITIYFIWAISIILIIYYPLYTWYQKNEINPQHQISPKIFISILIIFVILPFLYFFLNLKILNYKKTRVGINTISVMILMIVTLTYIFVEIYNYRIRLPLNEICHQQHSSDQLKLECCLDAEYVWNEGFSYFDLAPKQCLKFMNYNN
tara:strand:+ start:328 stop:876 length:549 start_codon:yes stop_codon:yes gene_type:complete